MDMEEKINNRAYSYKEYNKLNEMNLALLNELIDIAQSNGNKVILLDLPDNPIYEEQISKFKPHYDNMIRKVVADKGVGYIDMRYAAVWEPEDFRDVHHMRSFGRNKLTEALAVKLSDYMKTDGGSKTGI